MTAQYAVATVKTATNAGHDACGPTKGAKGNELLEINDSPVMCVGDPFEDHGPCGDPFNHPRHTPTIAEGSEILEVDGKPVAFVTCKVSCPMPNTVASGDDTVLVEKQRISKRSVIIAMGLLNMKMVVLMIRYCVKS